LRLGIAPDGKRYGQVVHFLDHQRVNHPTPSKLSGLAIVWEDSGSPHVALTEASPLKGKEGNGMEDRGAKGALAFAGKIIRLKEADHSLWKQSFLHLDLDASLASRDAYLSETEDLTARKNWFVSTAAWLRNKNEEAKRKPVNGKASIKAPLQFKPEAKEIIKPPDEERARQVQRLMKARAM
jgi:hypothetical protein